jgi:hypothetical protein
VIQLSVAILSLLAALTAFSLPGRADAQTASANPADHDIDTIRDSVVWIAADVETHFRVEGEDHPRELRDHNEGTGFVVAVEKKDGGLTTWVLTCAHVAAGVTVTAPQCAANSGPESATSEDLVLAAKTTKLTVTLQDGTVCNEASVAAADCEHDLAVVKLKCGKSLAVAPLSQQRVVERERLGCYGYPLGMNAGARPHYKTGACSRLGDTEFDHGIAVLSGMSGSPVFSLTTGQVVGVEVSTLAEQTGFATAVDIGQALSGVLKKAGVPLK